MVTRPLVFVSAVALGLLLSVIYAVRCVRGEAGPFNLSVMVSVVLYSSGVVAGGFLVASAFLPTLKARLSGLDIYVWIGGLAVFAVSIQGIVRDVFASRHHR